jgi:hypothetical protein
MGEDLRVDEFCRAVFLPTWERSAENATVTRQASIRNLILRTRIETENSRSV